MEFKRCSIGGVVYAGKDMEGIDQESLALLSSPVPPIISSEYNKGPLSSIAETSPVSPSIEQLQPANNGLRIEIRTDKETQKEKITRPYASPNPIFVDERLNRDIASTGIRSATAKAFFTMIAVCHSVMISKDDEDENDRPSKTVSKRLDPSKINYQAQSPDEAALVVAAKDLGFTFLGRENTSLLLDILGTPTKFTLLNVIEFNSTRKRMSVIVQNSNNEILLFCKVSQRFIVFFSFICLLWM